MAFTVKSPPVGKIIGLVILVFVISHVVLRGWPKAGSHWILLSVAATIALTHRKLNPTCDTLQITKEGVHVLDTGGDAGQFYIPWDEVIAVKVGPSGKTYNAIQFLVLAGPLPRSVREQMNLRGKYSLNRLHLAPEYGMIETTWGFRWPKTAFTEIRAVIPAHVSVLFSLSRVSATSWIPESCLMRSSDTR